MKLRSDSPFVKLNTKEKREEFLIMSKEYSLFEVQRFLAQPPLSVQCSLAGLGKFLKRLREEEAITQAAEAAESTAELSRQGGNEKTDEATLAATRQKLFASALETDNREALLEMYRALNEEKGKNRRLELEERKVRVAE